MRFNSNQTPLNSSECFPNGVKSELPGRKSVVTLPFKPSSVLSIEVSGWEGVQEPDISVGQDDWSETRFKNHAYTTAIGWTSKWSKVHDVKVRTNWQ